ncbi:hypothetical protein ACQ86N_36540 [Puia sp. P3]|uniref:hypothetical protein n=1 Tax=Puia sp. P3 TaxID=3423952 RepID=UPI003D67DA42
MPSELVKTMPSWLSFAKLYGSWGRKPLALDIYATSVPYSLEPVPVEWQSDDERSWAGS